MVPFVDTEIASLVAADEFIVPEIDAWITDTLPVDELNVSVVAADIVPVPVTDIAPAASLNAPVVAVMLPEFASVVIDVEPIDMPDSIAPELTVRLGAFTVTAPVLDDSVAPELTVRLGVFTVTAPVLNVV